MEFKKYVKCKIDLDSFLDSFHFSKKDIHLLKMEHRIFINDKLVTNNIQLKTNDICFIDLIKNEAIDKKASKQLPIILYEDDIVLVVDKPEGIIIHDDGSLVDTLDNMVAAYYLATKQKHRVYHIHRLDKETSGCILYCKQPFLVSYFDYCLKEKIIKRSYLAVVQGIINSELVIDKPIGKDRHVSNKYRVSSTGKKAVTHIFPIKSVSNQTLVKCILETGRTHQIRVHLSSINHPIIGDDIYGKTNASRMMLHSYEIEFPNPLSGKIINVKSKKEGFI